MQYKINNEIHNTLIKYILQCVKIILHKNFLLNTFIACRWPWRKGYSWKCFLKDKRNFFLNFGNFYNCVFSKYSKILFPLIFVTTKMICLFLHCDTKNLFCFHVLNLCIWISWNFSRLFSFEWPDSQNYALTHFYANQHTLYRKK